MEEITAGQRNEVSCVGLNKRGCGLLLADGFDVLFLGSRLHEDRCIMP